MHIPGNKEVKNWGEGQGLGRAKSTFSIHFEWQVSILFHFWIIYNLFNLIEGSYLKFSVQESEHTKMKMRPGIDERG